MDKYIYLKNLLKECLNESVDEYKNFDGTFDEFKKAYPMRYTTDRGKSLDGGRVYLYNISNYYALPGIFSTGHDRQFVQKDKRQSGEGTDTYGKGVCTTQTYEGTYQNWNTGKRRSYGGDRPVIVKYVLKGGFKDFLAFDDVARKNYGITDTPSQQIRKRFPKEFQDRYEKHIKSNSINGYLSQKEKDMGIEMLDLPYRDYLLKDKKWNSARNFVDFLMPTSTELHDDFSEKEMREAGLRGYISYGTQDHDLVVVKNFKDLLPIGYTEHPAPTEDGVEWKTDWKSDDGDTFEIATEENFNNINNSEDLIWRYGHKYPETEIDEPTIAGHTRVKNNGKYNFVNLDNDNEVLPYWATDAESINPYNRTSKVTINGQRYLLMIMGNTPKVRKLSVNNNGEEVPVGPPMDPSRLKE